MNIDLLPTKIKNTPVILDKPYNLLIEFKSRVPNQRSIAENPEHHFSRNPAFHSTEIEVTFQNLAPFLPHCNPRRQSVRKPTSDDRSSAKKKTDPDQENSKRGRKHTHLKWGEAIRGESWSGCYSLNRRRRKDRAIDREPRRVFCVVDSEPAINWPLYKPSRYTTLYEIRWTWTGFEVVAVFFFTRRWFQPFSIF